MELIEKLEGIIFGLQSQSTEVFLALSLVLLIIVDLILTKKGLIAEGESWLWGFSLATTIFTLFLCFKWWGLVQNTELLDAFATQQGPITLSKILIVVCAIFALAHIKYLKYKLPHEFYTLFIFQLLGLFLLCNSHNFLMVYISIEIVSIASYIFVSLKLDKKAAEAALKYALFGGVSSAIMLLGISLFYGITGSLDFQSIAASRFLNQIDGIGLNFVLLLIMGGLLFKLSAFPFHIWAPDAYQATHTPVISYLSVAPKIAAVLIIVKLQAIMPDSISLVLGLLAIASIGLGNIAALGQRNVKRMMAYSGIAQAGFILLAIIGQNLVNIYFYLLIYLLANMLVFFLVDLQASKQSKAENLIDFEGAGQKSPIWGIAILVGLLSLVGLPPAAGFNSKLFIFSDLWSFYEKSNDKFLLLLLVFGLINTAISLYYYLKIPYFAFFKNQKQQGLQDQKQNNWLLLLALPIVWFFIKSDTIIIWLQKFLN